MTETTAPQVGLPPSTGDEFLKVELRGLEPVPDAERHGHPRELFFIWAAALADFFSFYAGAILVGVIGLGVAEAIVVLVLGALAGALLLGPLSVTGVRTGLPQIVYSRLVFGRRGAAIGGLLTMVIAVGWFSYDCAIAVNTARALPVFGSEPASWLVVAMLVAMVAGCILVAVFGHRTITIVQTVQAPSFLLLCAVLTFFLWPHFHPDLRSSLEGGAHTAALLLGFTATFALIISWATYAGDYSRYLPRGSNAVAVSAYSGAGSMVTLVVCGVLGVLIQSMDPKADIAQLIVHNIPTWLAWTFVAFIVVAEMSSNYLNIYTAALSGLAIGLRLRRWRAALLVGLLGGAFALFVLFNGSFQGNYLNFLTATYVWFPAWCVVVLYDFAHRRGRVDEGAVAAASAAPGGVRWMALAAFAMGTLATLLFYNNQPFYQGVGARLLFDQLPADISSFVGIGVTAVIAAVLFALPRRPRIQPASASGP